MSAQQNKQDRIDWGKTKTVSDVKARQRERGLHWFGPNEMRFFNTKIHTKELIGGRYFVTSERFGDEPRHYSVRVVRPNFEVDTVGTVGDYATASAAKAAAKALTGNDQLQRGRDWRN